MDLEKDDEIIEKNILLDVLSCKHHFLNVKDVANLNSCHVLPVQEYTEL